MPIIPGSNKAWRLEQIPLKDLELWDANSRLPDSLSGSTQEKLISDLIQQYGADALAEEIVLEADLPQLERIVTWSDGKSITVLEGNRRVAAYKCLADPYLAHKPEYIKRFQNLKKMISIDGSFRLDALVTSDKKERFRFLERKHYKGNNELPWGQNERDNHIKRTRSPDETPLSARESQSIFRANLSSLVKETDMPADMMDEALGQGFVTTLFRILDSEGGRQKLGYERSGTEVIIQDKSTFLKLLRIIICNVIKKEQYDGTLLNSRTLNSDADIKKYLSSISLRQDRWAKRIIATRKNNQGKSKKLKKKSPKKSFVTNFPVNLPTSAKLNFSQTDSAKLLSIVLGRFSNLADTLQKGRLKVKLRNEYHVQALIEGILKLFFTAIYPEEWTPSYLGSSKRVDFLLKNQKIVLEIKRTRKGLNDKKISKELVEDTHHYNESKDCEILCCFIYDPEKRLKDPERIINDIQKKTFSNMDVYCTIVG